jgi:hypothetical protein
MPRTNETISAQLNPMSRARAQGWFAVVLFAIAMAWVEAAVVLYLRKLVGRIDPYQPKPFREVDGLATTEVVREAATMIMLLAVGWLAGRNWRARFGYLLIAFGVWDIFYYVFLNLLTGWPRSLLDWDILFLIPLPWWGPVITPMSVAALMILFGTLCVHHQPPLWPRRRSIALSACGIFLLLWAFMFQAIGLVWRGANFTIIRDSIPQSFPWPLFGLGFFLAAASAIDLGLQWIVRSGFKQTASRREQYE